LSTDWTSLNVNLLSDGNTSFTLIMDQTNRNKVVRLIFTIILLCIRLSVYSETYYISPKGDDNTGNGSRNSPWKSLYLACSQVKMRGDTIFVMAGKYDEVKTSNLAPGVSLLGEGITSIITSTVLTDEWIPIVDMRSPSIENGEQTISHLNFDGSSLKAAQAVWIAKRNNVEIHHCIFNDFNYTGIVWVGDGGKAGGDPYDNITLPSNYVTGSSFHDNKVANCALNVPNEWGRGALYIGGHDGMLLYNNIITQTSRPKNFNGYPIKAFANGGFMKGWKVYNNTITKIDSGNASWGFAIEGAFFSGCEFYKNTIIGAIDINFMNKGNYDYSVYIHDNTLGPATTSLIYYSGIILEFGIEDVIIERNEIRNCAIGVQHTMRYPAPWVKRVKVCYNKFLNLGSGNYHSALRFGEKQNNFDIQDYEIYNNTFQGNPRTRPYFGLHIRGFKSASNIKVLNNIFTNFGWSWFESNRGDFFDSLYVENNLLYNNGNLNSTKLNGTPNGYFYSGNIMANPRLYSDTNLHPKSNSPVIDAGKYIPGAKYDFDGKPVNNPPNIGCFETIEQSDQSGISNTILITGTAIILIFVAAILIYFKHKQKHI
jgi:hypothetical protein